MNSVEFTPAITVYMYRVHCIMEFYKIKSFIQRKSYPAPLIK